MRARLAPCRITKPPDYSDGFIICFLHFEIQNQSFSAVIANKAARFLRRFSKRRLHVTFIANLASHRVAVTKFE